MATRTEREWTGILNELRKLREAVGWVEFKENNTNHQTIGEYISALSNTAALEGKPKGYLVWGVADADRSIVGTPFEPEAEREGNIPLDLWLTTSLQPRIDFRFVAVPTEEGRTVLLEIDAAAGRPVAFKGTEYIRIGEAKTRLQEHPHKQRELWRTFDRTPFERQCAYPGASRDDVLRLLNYPRYFELLDLPLPETPNGIVQALEKDKLIRASDAGGWDILCLGATTFARDMRDFDLVHRKPLRIVVYRGDDRVQTLREFATPEGYASGFESFVEKITISVPENEVLGTALRTSVPMYPSVAIRELVANALIHQDFGVSGSGPMVEIFEDRIEIRNPGEPLIAPERFLDHPPQSRNEFLAGLMRRMDICEERGSGIDKVITQVEVHQLPAPEFLQADGHTTTILYAHRPLADMTKDDRIRAIYQHACLMFVRRKQMSNSTVRERFNIREKDASKASRLIQDAVDAGAIVIAEADSAKRLRRYVPFWASE